MKLLLNILFVPFLLTDVFAQVKDKYISQQEIEHYNNIRNNIRKDSCFFKAVSDSFVLQFSNSVVKQIDSDNCDNPFVSVWERNSFVLRMDKLRDSCLEKRRDEGDNSRADESFKQCRDSIEDVRFNSRIGNVMEDNILRYDSIENKHLIVYSDPKYGFEEWGYWIAISMDKGFSWNYYFTGLVENNFYYFKRNSTIDLFKSDSIIQIETALVKTTFPGAHPGGTPEFELVKDNIIIELNLNQIIIDSDKDGLSDILENRYLINPRAIDTDKDGITDNIDKNPRYKNIDNKYAVLYRFLLEYSVVNWDTIFIPFESKLTEFEDMLSIPNFELMFFLKTDNESTKNLNGTKNTYIIVSNEEYKNNKIDAPWVRYITPLFQVDNMKNYYKISVGGNHWSSDYLVIEKSDSWQIELIGRSID